eukprot:jgi/Bigna1/61275/fgenesh1_kg.20_\
MNKKRRLHRYNNQPHHLTSESGGNKSNRKTNAAGNHLLVMCYFVHFTTLCPNRIPFSSFTSDYAKRFLKKSMQPHNGHYGGMGLAKASIWLPLHDPLVERKFAVIFNEHIQGFGGKSFKKKKKDWKNKDDASIPLWRQRLAAKQKRDSEAATKSKKKRKRKG